MRPLLSVHWAGLSPGGTVLVAALVFLALVPFLVNTGTQAACKWHLGCGAGDLREG